MSLFGLLGRYYGFKLRPAKIEKCLRKGQTSNPPPAGTPADAGGVTVACVQRKIRLAGGVRAM